MHRRVSLAKLDRVRGDLEIIFTEAAMHISDSGSPSLSCDLNMDG